MIKNRIVTLLLWPLLWTQGKIIRYRLSILPEPLGHREGIAGYGPFVKVLIIGDSSAAGVGVTHQSQALTGQLVKYLAKTHRVQWRLLAKTDATTHSMLKELHALEEQQYDIVLVSLGVNDITTGVCLKKWLKQQKKLQTLLSEKFLAKRLIISGLQPISRFPSLPQPLRWYLGKIAYEFDHQLHQMTRQQRGVYFLSLRFAQNFKLMASDGLHPGPVIYSEWGRRATEIILD